MDDGAFEWPAYGSRDSASTGVYLNYNSASGLWILVPPGAQDALSADSVYDALAQYSNTPVGQLRDQVGHYIETNPDEVYDLFGHYDEKYGDVLAADVVDQGNAGQGKTSKQPNKPPKPNKPPIKPTPSTILCKRH